MFAYAQPPPRPMVGKSMEGAARGYRMDVRSHSPQRISSVYSSVQPALSRANSVSHLGDSRRSASPAVPVAGAGVVPMAQPVAAITALPVLSVPPPAHLVGGGVGGGGGGGAGVASCYDTPPESAAGFGLLGMVKKQEVCIACF